VLKVITFMPPALALGEEVVITLPNPKGLPLMFILVLITLVAALLAILNWDTIKAFLVDRFTDASA